MSDHPTLWPEEELPRSAPKLADKNFKSLNFPLWTENKSKLIQEYLRLFQQITHHGIYIDGFAAPQNRQHSEMWSAKRVLETEPKWFREFWLCDIDPTGISLLRELKAFHEDRNRKIEVLCGDFNEKVQCVLGSGSITEKKATFALLDQRTFECAWATVKALSEHKQSRKIELFYFFATGWIDRSLKALRRPETIAKVERWWGRNDWAALRGIEGNVRAKSVASRFEDELGYARATVYPIHSERRGGRVMYHMIHATDHPDAPSLMTRAYRRVSGRSDIEPDEQLDLEELIRRIENDEE